MSCRNCGGNRDCSRCRRQHNCEPDTIVDREIIRESLGFGVTVDGNYTADPDDSVINVIVPLTTPPAATPVITLADPDDAGPYGSVTVVAEFVDVTVTNLKGDGTGSVTVAAGSGATFYTIGGGDPCSETGAIWVPNNNTTPTP